MSLMIVFTAFALILALIASARGIWLEKQLAAHEKKYWDEARLHADTQLKLDEARQELNHTTQVALDLQEQLDTLNKEPEQEQEDEKGTFVKRKFYRPVTASTYQLVFDIDANGARILEHLASVFCKSIYVRGGHEADRESCFRAGQNDVVQYILKQVNKANDPNYKELEND